MMTVHKHGGGGSSGNLPVTQISTSPYHETVGGSDSVVRSFLKLAPGWHGPTLQLPSAHSPGQQPPPAAGVDVGFAA